MRGDRLREIREARQLSQEELADLCDVSAQQIYRYESGKSDPTGDVISRISKELGVSADWLLGLTDEKQSHYDGEIIEPEERKLIRAYRRGDVREAMRILANAPDAGAR